MFAAGYSEADREKVEARCVEKVGKQLHLLWTRVYDLIKVTHEDILANDYRTVFIEPGVPFSGDAMRINGPPPTGYHTVLCPSGLGMERVISTVTQGGRTPSEPTFERFVKPEVNLVSFVESIYRKFHAVSFSLSSDF